MDIKPCPFCGNTAYLTEIDGYRPSSPRTHQVRCITDGCEVESLECKTEAEAIAMWNRRPVEDALQKRVAELENFIMVARIRGDWWIEPNLVEG